MPSLSLLSLNARDVCAIKTLNAPVNPRDYAAGGLQMQLMRPPDANW